MTVSNADDWLVRISGILLTQAETRDEDSLDVFLHLDDDAHIEVASQSSRGPSSTMFSNGQVLHNASGSVMGIPTQHFLYMDCGLWAGDGGGSDHYPKHRNFGVVYGNWAALCSFEDVNGGGGIPVAAPPGAGTTFDDELADLNAILRDLASPDNRVRVIKAMRHVGPHARAARPRHGFVFIPDMHMPVTAGHGAADTDRVQPHGRLSYGGDASHSRAWWTQYGGSDIFEGAGLDLFTLLLRLHAFNAFPLTLVQLGDMVDLWIGFDPWFLPQPPSSPRVVPGVNARDLVSYWLARASNDWDLLRQNHVETGAVGNLPANGEVIRQMNAFPGRKVWIYGNHDSYLAALTAPPLAQRTQYFTEDHLLVEHGHQGDKFNRDGAAHTTFGQFRIPGGQWITNRVFQMPGIRSVESLVSDVRGGPLKWAAWSYLQRSLRGDPFSVFVMGHTHEPGLGRVHVIG